MSSDSIHELIAQMKRKCAPSDRGLADQIESEVDRMTGEIAALKIITSDSGVTEEAGIGPLTHGEQRLLAALKKAGDRGLSDSACMAAIYFDRPDGDWPHDDIMKVHVCKLRKKITASAYVIATVWGRGYRLELKRNFVPAGKGFHARHAAKAVA